MARRFLGETDLALEDISTAISINNQNDEAFFKRALIKKEQGDVEGAIEDYNSAITLNPDYTEAIYNRSFAYKVLGDYSSAELDVNQLIELPEDRPEYWNMKGNLLVLHGDLLAAIDCYSRAISYDNEYADAVYNRGIAFLLLNNPFKSCEDLELSIELGYSKAEVILENFCGQY
jgi:serine/threonine-protein kinase